jgi:hypothetical protein
MRPPVIVLIVIVGAALAASEAIEELAKSFRNKNSRSRQAQAGYEDTLTSVA